MRRKPPFCLRSGGLLFIAALFNSPCEAKGLQWEDALRAIALVESGRNHEPWPWTLNVGGTGYYFVDRESAWQAARLLETHHIDNFDIGLMQINWHYHKRRFRNTWQALDPKVNYRVAETILNEHLQETKSLSMAIAHYHSKNPREGGPYLKKILSVLESQK